MHKGQDQVNFVEAYPHLNKLHFFYDIKYSTETISIYDFVCLKLLLATVI